MINKRKKLIFIFLLCYFMFATTLGSAEIEKKTFTADQLYTRTFTNLLLDDPEVVAQIGLSNHPIFKLYNGELTNVSPQQQQKKITNFEKDLCLLTMINTDNLDNNDQLSYDIYKWYLQNEINGKAFLFYNYPINHYDGIQKELLEFFITTHIISDRNSSENYVQRLGKVNAKFNGLLEGLVLREKKGILPPTFVLEKTLIEMKHFISPEPQENILITSFIKKLDNSVLSKKDKAELITKATYQVQTSVYPAYQKIITYIETLLKKSSPAVGVWKHPEGNAYYRYKLRTYTTTNLTPMQIHQLGLVEVNRIKKEMTETIHLLGYTNINPGEFMKALAKDNRFKYTDTKEGRALIIQDYQLAIYENNRNTEACFRFRPQGNVEVKPVPEFNENSSPLAYLLPISPDGLRPSTLYINLGKIDDLLKYNTPSLAAHESIPGHHIQRGIQRQLQNVPLFRKILPFPAFAEGWAMYAEQLAWEQNTEKDPYDNLGRLQTELWRAVRLVVDTGIHDQHWTKEEALTYMVKNTGMPKNAVEIEIDRYIIDPGQACAYKIGMIKMLELREKAKKELGKNFNIVEFHHAILKNGAMPLEILEKQIDQYINTKKQACI